MKERDWQMLIEIPDEWDMLADIEDWMIPPYNELELERRLESAE